MLFFVPFALAGDLMVVAPATTQIAVDGVVISSPDGGAVARDLRPGIHGIEVRRGRRILDAVQVEVPERGRVRVEWAETPAGPLFTVFATDVRGDRHERPQGPPPRPVGPQPMDPPSFGGFQTQLQAATFDKDRLQLLLTATSRNYFLAEQASALLRTFDFDDKRIEATCMLAPRVLDPENAHILATTFDFESRSAEALACFR